MAASSRNAYIHPENTPPRGRTTVVEDDDMQEAFQIGWESLTSRHPPPEKVTDEAKYFKTCDAPPHRIDEAVWQSHQQQRRRNYKRRQKDKRERNDSRKVVKTLKQSERK